MLGTTENSSVVEERGETMESHAARWLDLVVEARKFSSESFGSLSRVGRKVRVKMGQEVPGVGRDTGDAPRNRNRG